MRRRTFVAAAAGALAAPRVALAADPKALDILRDAIVVEQLAAFVYSTGPREFEAFGAHEQEHADALASHVEALGSKRPPAPTSAAEADAALDRLGVSGRLGASGDAFLELALELELLQVAGYVAAAGDLDDVRLIQATASILAAEGAHLVVIREALGRAPLPNPLETGRA